MHGTAKWHQRFTLIVLIAILLAFVGVPASRVFDRSCGTSDHAL